MVDSGKAHEIFMKYCAAMAYIEVELPNGDRSIGSAFHVGEGVFVTAKHVVEGNKILEVASTDHVYVPLSGEEAENASTFVVQGDERIPSHLVSNGILEIDRGPFLDANDDVDIAVFRVREIDSHTPFVRLGSHLDDWLGHGDFVLSEAIVLGYPPIPMTREPVLIGTSAEVNAQVDLFDSSNVHFILSTMPRGGFSGGLAYSEYGFALGVVTRSLTSDHSPLELGFLTVVGIEPIYGCLADNYLLPDAQAEGWDGFWNSTPLGFDDPSLSAPGKSVRAATLELFDDGKRYALTIICDHNPEALESAIAVAESKLAGYEYTRSEIRPGMVKLDVLVQGDQTSAAVRTAGKAMSTVLMAYGYEISQHSAEDYPLRPSTDSAP
jgi:hypothetical protein